MILAKLLCLFYYGFIMLFLVDIYFWIIVLSIGLILGGVFFDYLFVYIQCCIWCVHCFLNPYCDAHLFLDACYPFLWLALLLVASLNSIWILFSGCLPSLLDYGLVFFAFLIYGGSWLLWVMLNGDAVWLCFMVWLIWSLNCPIYWLS